MVSLQMYLTQHRTRLEHQLLCALKMSSGQLGEAMRYSTLTGGKRLRPMLTYIIGEHYGAPPKALDILACAIELIHSYSLVHDDLPALDNDTERRGQPSCHCQFDEATAILAGDALLTLAFEVITANITAYLSADVTLSLLHLLSQNSGSTGMIYGQFLDITAASLTPELLDKIHLLKTSRLFESAVLMGYLAAAPQHQPEYTSLQHYAQLLGLAFQIQDDIVDYGNGIQGSAIYPAVIGISKSQQLLANIREKIFTLIADLKKPRYLMEITDHILNYETNTA